MFRASLVRFTFLILLFLGSVSLAFTQAPPTDPRAEEVADKIVRRFYETLDFGDIYREFYVKNEKIRQIEINHQVLNFLFQGDHIAGLTKPPVRNIEPAAMERAYIAWVNAHWTMEAAFRTRDGDEKSFMEKADLIWREHYDVFSKPSMWPILTSKELDERFTLRQNRLGAAFRGQVIKSKVGTAEFKKREAEIVESNPPEPVEHLIQFFSRAGMNKSDHVYVARRGELYLYFLEENGEIRMLFFGRRIRD